MNILRAISERRKPGYWPSGGGRLAVATLIAAVLALAAVPATVYAAHSSGAASPDHVDFGDVALNTTDTASVTMTIDAGYQVSGAIISAVTGDLGQFSFAFDTCGGGSGFTGPGTCTVQMSFTPTSLGVSSANLGLTVCPVGGGACNSIPASFTGTGITPPSITTASLADGAVGSAYSQTLAGADGTPPYTWSISTGALPNGLSLNASTGEISGAPTPQATGTTNFTAQLTDSASPVVTATKALSITVTSLLAVDPSAIDFGPVLHGQAVQKSATVTVDPGTQVTTATSGQFSVDQGTCAGFTGPGSCTLQATFTSIGLTDTGTLTVTECLGGSGCRDLTVSLSGNGYSPDESAAPTPTTPPAPSPAPTGSILSGPSFGGGNVGSAVFSGGSVADLIQAVTTAGGTAVWVQDANGVFQSYTIGGIPLQNAGFSLAFSNGVPGPVAIFIVK